MTAVDFFFFDDFFLLLLFGCFSLAPSSTSSWGFLCRRKNGAKMRIIHTNQPCDPRSQTAHRLPSRSPPRSSHKSVDIEDILSRLLTDDRTLIYVSKTPPLLSLGFLKVTSGSLPAVVFRSFSSCFLVLMDSRVRHTSLDTSQS